MTEDEIYDQFFTLKGDPARIRYDRVAPVLLRMMRGEYGIPSSIPDVDEVTGAAIVRHMVEETERLDNLVDGCKAAQRERALTDALAEARMNAAANRQAVAAMTSNPLIVIRAWLRSRVSKH